MPIYLQGFNIKCLALSLVFNNPRQQLAGRLHILESLLFGVYFGGKFFLHSGNVFETSSSLGNLILIGLKVSPSLSPSVTRCQCIFDFIDSRLNFTKLRRVKVLEAILHIAQVFDNNLQSTSRDVL